MRRLWGAVLAMAAALTVAGSARSDTTGALPDTAAVMRLEVAQAMLAMARGELVLVDVRPLGQRALGHVRGDVHIPIDRLATRQAELPRGKRLAFYCSCPAEELALDAAHILIEAGDPRVAVLVGGYDAWRAAGGPVQVEASWRESFRVDEPPLAWGKTPVDSTRCRYRRDTTVAAHGVASGCIACASDTASVGLAGFTQPLDARSVRGRKLELSAMVKCAGIDPAAFLWIGSEDAEGRFSGLTRPAAASIRGTRDWRLQVVTAAIPATAVMVMIGITVPGSGRLWIDDVRLAVPDEPGLPSVKLAVRNPGFEE